MLWKKIPLCPSDTWIMDNFWVEDTKKSFINKKGQALTEYILLISVISLMFISILKSEQFQDVFGEDANFFKKMRKKMAFEYRHGVNGEEDRSSNSYTGSHDSYYDQKTGSSRFFLSNEPYAK